MVNNLVYGILVAVAAFALIEGGIRLMLGPPPPPVSVYQVRGDVEVYLELSEETAQPTYQIQERIPPIPRTGGGAAVLGGSSVHVGGKEAKSPDEFASLLSDRLGVPFYNLGAPGLDSFDLVSIVDELSAVELDLLVVYTGHNDLGNVLFQQRYGDMIGGLSASMLPILEKLQIFSQLRRALLPPAGTTHPKKPSTIRRDRSLRPTAVQHNAAVRFFTANLKHIVWTCQRRDISLILVVPVSDLLAPPIRDPCKLDTLCPKTEWQRGVLANKSGQPEEGLAILQNARDIDPATVRATSAVEAAVRSFADEPGVTIIDAATDLPRMDGTLVPHRRMFEDAIHPSLAGHAALADLIEPAARSALQ